jgi:hypothetical protein
MRALQPRWCSTRNRTSRRARCQRGGRPKITEEIHALILQAIENNEVSSR